MGRGTRPGLLMLPAVIMATGCANPGAADPCSSGVDTGLLVLASTAVYASLGQDVVADTAEDEAIVDNPAVDPHSYEATPQHRLRVEEAHVLTANGGGSDPYIPQLAQSAGHAGQASQLISGEISTSHKFDVTHQNEHIRYDLSRMSELVADFGE